MPYNYKYLNRLDQFGAVSYDLVLTDTDDIMPVVRLGIDIKKAQDTPQYRGILAADKVQQAVDNYQASIIPDDSPPDEPPPATDEDIVSINSKKELDAKLIEIAKDTDNLDAAFDAYNKAIADPKVDIKDVIKAIINAALNITDKIDVGSVGAAEAAVEAIL